MAMTTVHAGPGRTRAKGDYDQWPEVPNAHSTLALELSSELAISGRNECNVDGRMGRHMSGSLRREGSHMNTNR